jgi:sulfite exporter TauE/SafE
MLDLFLAFTTGLLASLHCVGMCGGFVAAYSLRITGERASSSLVATALRPGILWAHLLYNAGRLTTYAILGGVMGLIGSFIAASGQLMGIQGLASVLAGAFMILLGLGLGRWLSYSSLLQPAWVSQFTKISALGRDWATRTMAFGTYPLGLLLGLMPCGPLYAMEINSAGTGSIGAGMLTMLAFGLGTVPTLYAFGLVSSAIGHKLPRRLLQVAALIVVLMGILTLLRGLAMNGLVPHAGLW